MQYEFPTSALVNEFMKARDVPVEQLVPVVEDMLNNQLLQDRIAFIIVPFMLAAAMGGAQVALKAAWLSGFLSGTLYPQWYQSKSLV